MKMRLKLKEILEERHMTQRELARQTRIRPTTISEYARDLKESVHKETLIKIAIALEIDRVQDLIEFVDE